MLKYNIGSGFIVGVPARDLSDEEVEKYGGEEFLIGTGLYVADPAGAAKSGKKIGKKAEKAEEEGE